MRRPRPVWGTFAVALALVLGGMGWVTHTALEARAERAATEREALLEEQVRLALWRMDAMVAPVIASDQRGEYVRLRFEVGPTGEVRAVGPAAADLVATLGRSLDATSLRTALPVPAGAPPVRLADADLPTGSLPLNLRPQRVRNDAEWSMRATNAVQSASLYANNYDDRDDLEAAAAEATPGVSRLLWHGGELLLARQSVRDGATWIEGSWLDWPRLSAALTASVQDLLPEARLEPLADAAAADAVDTARRLAAVDAVLHAGVIPFPAGHGEDPFVLTSLLLAWACVLLAAMATAWLLHGTMQLSERRGAFVSAVTHELRTPLTTFRMYTEMLAGGMVRDDDARDRYHQTLHAEAERLGHLVENVLAYSRLERRSTVAHLEDVSVGDLLARCSDRLVQRADEADMTLVVDLGAAADERVRVDVGAMDRVLFNLVDNACKYAATAEDRRIELTAEASARGVTVRVRDHGPGVAPDVRKKLFEPFAKSDREAARTAPGVGLGLALSRGLARAQGGELAAETPTGGGAAFALSLPRA